MYFGDNFKQKNLGFFCLNGLSWYIPVHFKQKIGIMNAY